MSPWKFIDLAKVNGSGFPAKFVMGNSKDRRESPERRITLSEAFEVQATEVTYSQWYSVMGSAPSTSNRQRQCIDYDRENEFCPNFPVTGISWNDVQFFLERLNDKTKETEYHYRLPTEAEWEYFARAGTRTEYNSGNSIDILRVNFQPADGKTNFRGRPVNVASLENSRWSLYDIHGNVWEFVQDSWRDRYSMAALNDPRYVNKVSDDVVVRGGSWYSIYDYCRSAGRWRTKKDETSSDKGFRLVRTKKKPKEEPDEDLDSPLD